VDAGSLSLAADFAVGYGIVFDVCELLGERSKVKDIDGRLAREVSIIQKGHHRHLFSFPNRRADTETYCISNSIKLG
jgi:hypothetical protein